MPDPIVISERPLNLETPLSALHGDVTDAKHFYVRNHNDVPKADPAAWRLRVHGHVERELSLSLADLRAMPERTLRVTMECAGNGRTDVNPQPKGTPWGRGAVSTGDFTGTPLAGVLEQAGLRDGAVEVAFLGADVGAVRTGGEEPYGRSLDPSVATGPDPLIVWAMNGRPLSPERGFPLRLVVPGWYGMAAVKWLESIEVRTSVFPGYYQAVDYRFVEREGTPDGTPVTRIAPGSLVLEPGDGASLSAGVPARVRGIAWSGGGGIVRVEVRVDDGPWWDAELGPDSGEFAQRSWQWTWASPDAGEHRLTVRATDAAGDTQPMESVWNRLGYVNNGCHGVDVRVTSSGR